MDDFCRFVSKTEWALKFVYSLDQYYFFSFFTKNNITKIKLVNLPYELTTQKVCSKTKSYTFTFCYVLALGSKKKSINLSKKKKYQKKQNKQKPIT